ncbi:MAG TPA: hypothetical protein VGQ64_04385 [Candidatus Limnocylindrales bacterium]|nr:hypothetical protein [Candidatus Limnocylindrales bacterium]
MGRVSDLHLLGIRVAVDEQHVALPKLYGAPAYARPAPPVEYVPRPFDPDDLPIEVYQTPEERDLAATLPARSYAPGGALLTGQHAAYPATPNGHEPELHPKPLSLRALAGRILGNGES